MKDRNSESKKLEKTIEIKLNGVNEFIRRWEELLGVVRQRFGLYGPTNLSSNELMRYMD